MASAKVILQGSTISSDGAVLRFFISGLTKNDHSALKEAYFASGLPYVPLVGNGAGPTGDKHPFVEGLFAVSLTVDEMAGQFGAYATVTYSPQNVNGSSDSGKPSISISTRTSSVLTELDADGNPIVVYFNTQSDDVNTPPAAADRKLAGALFGGNAKGEQGGEVEKQIPVTTLRIERTELESPLQKSVYYVGTVNMNTWSRVQKHGWLCTGIDGSSEDGGKTYKTAYEFSFIRDSWNKIAAWVKPDGIRPSLKNKPKFWGENPPYIQVDGLQRQLNGMTAVRVQGEQDFHKLNLPEIT